MNFQGFSSDSFEQFIRALALKVLGPGVTVFGNGPDGGREATFQGKINYPFPPNNTWDGYGVIQAKFKEKAESTQKDQEWAEKQLDAELTRWEQSQKRTPKPDFFIFCTNVELSSAKNGGHETLLKVFEKHKTKLGLKEYTIWDGNQLTGYVDGYTEIRQRFNCFFTPGDLLAEFAKALKQVPDPEAILTTFLGREILADEDARLSQAGDRSEDRIRLASVFMDLPVGYSASTEPPQEAFGQLPPASLHFLLRAASRKLDPIALYGQRERYDEKQKLTANYLGRFVFLGGPGSGKSTIGQFLAQINRAAILERRPPHRLEYKVQNVISDLKKRCQEEKVIWPATPRFPFRIELNAFAKALAAGPNNGVTSLSEYLRRNMSGDFTLTHENLRDWLRVFPWLLILDGLDEVPSSSNRREVVTAIQNFLNEARDVEADLMIVASSRPDGYGGEFDGDEVAQLHLMPFSKARALTCAQRYVTAKAAWKDDQRAKEAMAILTNAIENPLVARLMMSPLQVTFMVTVVAASGKPSESRWQLFNDYYRTIYERELHKAVRPFDKVLNQRRQDIDALHHKVGFILQCRGESSGGTQADMAIEEFEQLVTACLEENGLAAGELVEQKEMILGAAKLRLVFLTSRTPKRLSFDVRSLQEYMAAACITNDDSDLVMRRLDKIAHSAYWRNTLLFAVGRFFVEPQLRQYRDKIRLLCQDLNLKDIDRANIKLGSRLALDILESGTIGNVPLISRSLASCMLELLAIPPEGDDIQILQRMATVYDSSIEMEFRNAISLWLGQKNFTLTLSAWLLLLLLENKGVGWAVEMALEKWPTTKNEALILLAKWCSVRFLGQKINSLTLQRLQWLIPRLSYSEFDNNFSFEIISVEPSQMPWLSPLTKWWAAEKDAEAMLIANSEPSGFTVKFNRIPTEEDGKLFQIIQTMELEKELHPEWKHFLLTVAFMVEPSASNLAMVLESIANSMDVPDWKKLGYEMPWPITCCLESASTKKELLSFVSEARSGKLGDLDAWITKQEAWKEVGIKLDELCTPLFQGNSYLISGVGRAVSSTIETDAAKKTSEIFFQKYKDSNSSIVKETLAWMLAFYWRCQGTLGCLDPKSIESQILPVRKVWTNHDFYIGLDDFNKNREAWIKFFDTFGKMQQLRCVDSGWRNEENPMRWILEAFIHDNSKIGLLHLSGFFCAIGQKILTKNLLLPSVEKFTEAKYKLSVILIRISQPELTHIEAGQISDQLPAIIDQDSEPQCLDILLIAIERHAQSVFALEVLLLRLTKLIPLENWQLRGRAYAASNTFLQRRVSGLDIPMLNELKLPSMQVYET